MQSFKKKREKVFRKCFVNPARSIYLIKPLKFDGVVLNLHIALLGKLNVEHSKT